MYSVLQNKKNITFKFDKFPYIVIDNALPNDLYEKLNNSFPEYKKIIGSNDFKENFAYRYNAISSLKDEEITKEWKDFIKYHTSYEFLQELAKANLKAELKLRLHFPKLESELRDVVSET